MLGDSVGGGQALMGRGLNVVMWVHGAATHSEMDRMHRPAPGGEGAEMLESEKAAEGEGEKEGRWGRGPLRALTYSRQARTFPARKRYNSPPEWECDTP